MGQELGRVLSLLRKEKKLSQRVIAGKLGISQALLSHYENGIREPGLDFVVRAGDYYDVSVDFLLGRTMARDGGAISAEGLFDAQLEKDNSLKNTGALALLSKKLVINAIGLIFDLLGKSGRRAAVKYASEYFSTAIYKMFRHLYAEWGIKPAEFFSVPAPFFSDAADADMKLSELRLRSSISADEKEEKIEISDDSLRRDYPQLSQSLFSVLHSSGERINANLKGK